MADRWGARITRWIRMFFDSVAYDNLHNIPVTTPITCQLLNWCIAGTTQMLAKDSNASKEWMAYHATYPELADVIRRHILACMGITTQAQERIDWQNVALRAKPPAISKTSGNATSLSHMQSPTSLGSPLSHGWGASVRLVVRVSHRGETEMGRWCWNELLR